MNKSQSSPIISVIVNSYNSTKYIDGCIQSILDQTFKDFELIIVDCSNDDTFEKLLRYRDPRILLKKIEGRISLSRARNLSLSIARGTYIALMDADDICVNDRLERQLEHLQLTNADICGSWYYELDDASGSVRKRRTVITDRDIKALLTVYNPICNPTSFFKKGVLRPIPYREDYLYAEDSEMWLELATRAKFTIAPFYLIYYRVHDEQLSRERLDAPMAWFNKARDKYLETLLGAPGCIQKAALASRLRLGLTLLFKLNRKLNGISFRASCEIYSRFQLKTPRILSPLRRMERFLIGFTMILVRTFRIRHL
jgi:glycosyltransferase involved in cell wall biosynthesis